MRIRYKDINGKDCVLVCKSARYENIISLHEPTDEVHSGLVFETYDDNDRVFLEIGQFHAEEILRYLMVSGYANLIDHGKCHTRFAIQK